MNTPHPDALPGTEHRTGGIAEACFTAFVNALDGGSNGCQDVAVVPPLYEGAQRKTRRALISPWLIITRALLRSTARLKAVSFSGQRKFSTWQEFGASHCGTLRLMP